MAQLSSYYRKITAQLQNLWTSVNMTLKPFCKNLRLKKGQISSYLLIKILQMDIRYRWFSVENVKKSFFIILLLSYSFIITVIAIVTNWKPMVSYVSYLSRDTYPGSILTDSLKDILDELNEKQGYNNSKRTNASCIFPKLEIWKGVEHFFKDWPKPLVCKGKQLTYINNGSIMFTKELLGLYQNHSDLNCEVVPWYRGNGDDYDDIKFGHRLELAYSMRVPSDFMKVRCWTKDNLKLYTNLHFAIKRRKNFKPVSKKSMGFNVVILGFDSVSRMNWMRVLPKTHEYFTEKLGGHVLKGYNVVGKTYLLAYTLWKIATYGSVIISDTGNSM